MFCFLWYPADRYPADLALVGPITALYLIRGGLDTMTEQRSALWEHPCGLFHTTKMASAHVSLRFAALIGLSNCVQRHFGLKPLIASLGNRK